MARASIDVFLRMNGHTPVAGEMQAVDVVGAVASSTGPPASANYNARKTLERTAAQAGGTSMIGEILDTIAPHRSRLLWCYGALLLLTLAWPFGDFQWPGEVLVWCLGGSPPDSLEGDWSLTSTLVVGGGFVALQAAFLWGGGAITDRAGRHPGWRNALSMVIASSLTAINIWGLYLIFADWSDRADSARSSQYGGLFASEKPWQVAVPLAVALAGTFAGVFWRTHSLSRRASCERLLTVVLFSTWLTFSVSIATQSVVSTHPSDRFLSFLTASLFTYQFTLMELLWCAGLLLYLLRRRDRATIPAPPGQKPLEGGPYVDSAKSIASLLLIISYFGVVQAAGHAADLDKMIDARTAFSKELIRTYLTSLDAFKNWQKGAGATAKTADAYAWLQQNIPQDVPFQSAWADGAKVRVTLSHAFFFGPPNLVFEVTVNEYKSTRPWVTRTPLDVTSAVDMTVSDSEIDKAAAFAGINPEKDENYAQLYFRTENELLRRQVALPSSGFSFPIGQLVWICLLVVMVMLILLDDRIRNVFRDPQMGYGEPWLILDAERGLGWLAANLWVFLLLAAPWLLGVMVVRMVSLGVRADGSVSYLASDIFMYITALALIWMNGLLSLRVISGILLLRRMQALTVDPGNRAQLSAAQSGAAQIDSASRL